MCMGVSSDTHAKQRDSYINADNSIDGNSVRIVTPRKCASRALAAQ